MKLKLKFKVLCVLFVVVTVLLFPVASYNMPGDGSLRGLSGQRQLKAPFFTREPSNRVDFLNDLGATIGCVADGYPPPQIHWQGPDNKILSNVDNFRTVLSNSTLRLHPFKPASYRQDVHTATYRCVATNAVGSIRSRDVQVRAVIAQQWSAKVRSFPNRPALNSAVLLKCDIDLIGGGRDFIEVAGWKRDGKLILYHQSHFGGEELEQEDGRFHLLPNGDLVIDSVQPEDTQSKITCLSSHKLTKQQTTSSPLSLTISSPTADKDAETIADEEQSIGSSLSAIARSRADGSIIPESFPGPIVVREGDPIVLHCYESSSLFSSSSSSIPRWEKLSGSSWMEISSVAVAVKSFRVVGGSLVAERSMRSQTGHYRCTLPAKTKSKGNAPAIATNSSPTSKQIEFEVRVTEPLSVEVSITQTKSPLESTAEIICSATSSTTPSITWLKDTVPINPGGRIRFFSNSLQISQIQRDDQGMYQCIAKTEMESAQAAIRLELADAQPRLIYGFIEQTLAPGPFVSLRCGFSGWPTPSVSWLLDGWAIPSAHDSRILIGDHVTSHGHLISYLNISETRVEDGGLYGCKAANRAGSITHSARLNIYGAPWIRVVPPVVAISGEFFALNCPIAGWPISFSAITWDKDGQKLPVNQRHRIAPNGTVAITLVDKSDAGTYWCSITDSQGRSARREIQVNVVAPLRITPFADKGRVVEGERVTLVCALSSGDTPLQLRWTMMPKEDEMSEGVGAGRQTEPRMGILPAQFNVVNTDPFTSLLSIGKVTEGHTGKYFCDATSAAGSVSRSHELTVLVAPKIEPFSFPAGLTEKMMTRLLCGISKGDMPIHFTWFKDGEPLLQLQQSHTQFINGPSSSGTIANVKISPLDHFSTMLNFPSLTAEHSGIYTCLVSNLASQTSFSAKLVVQVAPRWIQEPVDLNVSRGREARFDCIGHGVPPPWFSWFKSTGDGMAVNWRPIDNIWSLTTAQTLLNGSLLFHSVQEDNEGQYMCNVNNSIGSGLSKVVTLHVNVPPYFTSTVNQPVSLTQGKMHEISCEAVSSAPLTVTWTKSSTVFVNVPANRIHTSILTDGRKTRATLVMKDIRSDDSGLYQCSASNSLGKVTRTYRLVVEEQPGAPGNLRYVRSIESSRIFLEWDRPLEPPPGANGLTHSSPPILLYVIDFSLVGDKVGGSNSNDNSNFNVNSNSNRVEVSGDRTSGKVENLSPASVYSFRVRAINSAGSGPPSEELIVRTANVPPSSPPNNVRALSVSSRAILVSWSPIPAEMSFGKILAYRILIRTNMSEGRREAILVPVAMANNQNQRNGANGKVEGVFHSLSLQCCQYIVHGLMPYTTYEIRLAAMNIAGTGPSSPFVPIRTTEEVPQTAPRSPQCVSLTSHSLQLSWLPPITPNGAITSYKLHFYPLSSSNQRSGESHRTSGQTSVIGGLSPNTNYSFQITAVNIAGEGRQWLSIFCKTSEDVPTPPVNLIGFPNSERSIYLSWTHPRKPNGILSHHTIYFRVTDKSSESYEIKRTVGAGVDTFEETGLDLTRFKYVFWATSSNRMGESASSSQLVFSPPPLVEPRLVGQPRNVEAHQGTPLSLQCRILGLPSSSTNGGVSPDAPVTWQFNGKRVTLDGNVYMKPGQGELFFFSVRKSDEGNYTCQPKSKKLINGMDLQLTYILKVKGVPCSLEPTYRLVNRDIYISWTVGEQRLDCDIPLGFILFYRILGSVLDLQKLIFQSAVRNYTLRDIACGSTLNLFMVAFNEVGNSVESPVKSIAVTHQVAPLPSSSEEILVANSTSVKLNLYPLGSNGTFCDAEKFSVAVREWKAKEWVLGTDIKMTFHNEYTVDNLKPATPYEISVSSFGYTTSRSASYVFTTLTEHGEIPSTDVLSKHKVTSEYAPLYDKLTLIVPVLIALVVFVASFATALAYCKTRRRGSYGEEDNLPKQRREGIYGSQSKGLATHGEQFYSSLGPPCTPGMEDISPYATFQISDPKKFREESFSGEIAVTKFHPVMHGIPRGSHDKWLGGRDRHTPQDYSDSESENTARYAVIPASRPRMNPYQMNPGPVPGGNLSFHGVPPHAQQQIGGISDCDSSSSSEYSPNLERRAELKDRCDGRRTTGKKSKDFRRGSHPIKDSNSSGNIHRHTKRKSNPNVDYSIAV